MNAASHALDPLPEWRVRRLGRVDYETAWRAMQDFTQRRDARTADELWLLEHPAIYTLGLNAKRQHLPEAGNIPVIHVDRGGQITYHGPGQLIAYVLLDLARRGLGVWQLVTRLEQSVIALLADHGIAAQARQDAPGVYVHGRKIASLGLRVRHGCCYHGLSLNVAMDLEPFRRIAPCGYPDLEMTQFSDLGGPSDPARAGAALCEHLAHHLGYNSL